MTSVLEARMFRQVEGGYIFQSPPATIFHRTHAYRVNEAQKADILAAIQSGTGSRMRLVTWSALALGVASGVAIDLTTDAPLWASFVLGFVAFFLAQVLGTSLTFHVTSRRLRPILTGLPRSDEQLFPTKTFRELAFAGPSPGGAAAWCALSMAFLGSWLQQHPILNAVSIVALISLAMNLFWVIAGLVKPRGAGPRMTSLGRTPEPELTLERLATRVERQEGFMYGLRWIVPVLLIAVLLLGAVHVLQPRMAFTADSITADSITTGSVAVRNAAGEIVALVSPLADGTPHISLFDAQRKVRLSIGLRPNGGPAVTLIDPDQRPRAVLSLNDQQDPSLTMFDNAKLPRGLLGLDTGGSGTIILSGPNGGLALSSTDGRLRWNPAAPAPDAPGQP
jgi:hypothetical protein